MIFESAYQILVNQPGDTRQGAEDLVDLAQLGLRFDPDYPLRAGEVVDSILRDAGVTCAGFFTGVDRDFTTWQRPIPEVPRT